MGENNNEFDLDNVEVSNIRLEFFDQGGIEMKWSLFYTGKRASIGKLIAELVHHQPIIESDNSSVSSQGGGGGGFLTTGKYFKTAHIKSIHVHKDFRGRNLSKLLVNRCKATLKEQGFDRIILEAEEDTERYGKLVKLYSQCGFSIVGDESHVKYLYNDDQCFRKVPMVCYLNGRNGEDYDQHSSSSSKIEESNEIYLLLELGTEAHIKELRGFMSYDFVHRMREEALILDHAQLTIMEALKRLDGHISGSLAKSISFARFIREQGHPEWLQFAGLIHQLGRIQETFLWRTPYDGATTRRYRQIRRGKQKAEGSAEASSSSFSSLSNNKKEENEENDDEYGGFEISDANLQKAWPLPEAARCDFTESWVVGYPLPSSLPFPQYNSLSQDQDNNRYSEHCGLDNVLLAWSQTEYMWTVLQENQSLGLPIEVPRIIRYQNLHTQNLEFLMNIPDDEETLDWVHRFRDILSDFNSATLTNNNLQVDLEMIDDIHDIIEQYYPGILRF